MTIHNRVNQLTSVEQAPSSDQNRTVDPENAQPPAKPQMVESVADDVEEEDAEDKGPKEEEDADEAARDETATTESLSQGDAANSAPTSSAPALTQSTANPDERCEIEKQPYDCAPHHAA